MTILNPPSGVTVHQVSTASVGDHGCASIHNPTLRIDDVAREST